MMLRVVAAVLFAVNLVLAFEYLGSDHLVAPIVQAEQLDMCR